MAKFDPYEPFTNKKLLKEILTQAKGFDFKLYGKINPPLYRGRPTTMEFDLDLGVMHFTEVDFWGMTDIVQAFNKKWGTEITFCIYPARDRPRHMIINIRSPKAPVESD